MKNQMKGKNTTEKIGIKKRVTLGRIPDAEQWLHEMALQGLMLSEIKGRTFYFQAAEAEPVFYFMLSPERGGSNPAWVYYEFLENGGIRIPHHGSSHLSPNLVLKIPNHIFYENKKLYRYYFAHRNYRLYHRFVTNILLSLIFFFLGTITIHLDRIYLISLFGWLLGSFLVGLYNAISLHHFLKFCRTQGIPAMWKRPRRPGY